MSLPWTPEHALAKIPFRNDDAEAIPPCGVMQVSGSIVEDGVTFLTCSQVGATLLTEFAVNGLTRVPAGQKGVCYRQGDLSVLYDEGTPAAGQGWGVRAWQWSLSQGYPALASVHGVRSDVNRILQARVAPIRGVVGKCGSGLPEAEAGTPGSGSVAVYVWDGSSLVAADPSMSFTGYNLSNTAIETGSMLPFVAADGLWIAAGSSSGGGTKLLKARLNGALTSGTSIAVIDTVTSLDAADPPATTSALNLFALAGLDNDDCLIVEDTSGEETSYLLVQVSHHICGT